MKNWKVSRKKFLKFTGSSTALLFLPNFFLNSCENGAEQNLKASNNFSPDVEIELTAHKSSEQILPGKKTNVWKYSGSVKKGRKDSLQILNDSYLGPVFRGNKGEKGRIVF